MRMWMVDPKIMCRQHLIGEWRELFTILGTLKAKKRIDGYIKNDLIEPVSLFLRYIDIKREMLRRDYNPQKKADFVKIQEYVKYLPQEHKVHRVDVANSLQELITRCPECNKRFHESLRQNIIIIDEIPNLIQGQEGYGFSEIMKEQIERYVKQGLQVYEIIDDKEDTQDVF